MSDKKRYLGRDFLTGLTLLALLASTLLALWPTPAQAAGIFTDPAYQRVWGRTDQAVAAGGANRSWFWGPESFAHTTETYLEASGAQRKVLYFDKSRMEINNPNGDKNSAYYVTNGLLTKELVSGAMQTGDNAFLQGPPANIPVAGDLTSTTTPTYASMAAFSTLSPGENTAQSKNAGTPVSDQLDRNGKLSKADNTYGVTIATYIADTNHNIPDVFWNWMNDTRSGFDPSAGIDWVYVLGYPIGEPYWTNAQVGGQSKPVLIQLFQRRALTFTPSNNDPYKVEMGNIGQHYYRWRYSLNPYTLSLTSAPQGDYRLLAVGREGGNQLGLTMFTINGDGSGIGPRYSIFNRKTSPNGNYVAFTSPKSTTNPNDVSFKVAALSGGGAPLDLPLPADARVVDYNWQGGVDTGLNLLISVAVRGGSDVNSSVLLYNIAAPNAQPKTIYSVSNATLLNPTASPDGRLLLVGQRGQSSGLFVVRLDKTGSSAQLVSGSSDYCFQGGFDEFGGSTNCTSFEWSPLSGPVVGATPSSSEVPGTFAYLHGTDHKIYQVDVKATDSALNDKSKTLASSAADLLGWQPNGSLILYVGRESGDYIYYTLDSRNPSTRFEVRRLSTSDAVLPTSLERWLGPTLVLSGDDVNNGKIVNYNGTGGVALIPANAPKPIDSTLALSPSRLAYLTEDWKLVLADRDGYSQTQIVDLTKYAAQLGEGPSRLDWVNVLPGS